MTERFEFGKNWRAFLKSISEDRIAQAARSLRELIPQSLGGKRFLDLGSGSGLFSLAANRLGAEVVSIDYDSESVACTGFLRDNYADVEDLWSVQQGSVLDESLPRDWGQFDVVYSWGVLHHTGDMWRAIDLSTRLVAERGYLVISIYNDQGSASRRWLAIKQTYHRFPAWLRPAFVAMVAGVYETKFSLARLKNGRNPLPFSDWRAKKQDRGMSAWHDWVDWVGGLPFEVASPDAVEAFVAKRGFELQDRRAVGKGWGCNEFVFRKTGGTR